MELSRIPNHDELSGVFYDRVDGIYAIFTVDEDAETISMLDPRDGALIHDFGVEEFMDEWETGSFSRVNESALDDPASYLEAFIQSNLGHNVVRDFDPVSVEFALEVMNFVHDEEATAWEEQGGVGRQETGSDE